MSSCTKIIFRKRLQKHTTQTLSESHWGRAPGCRELHPGRSDAYTATPRRGGPRRGHAPRAYVISWRRGHGLRDGLGGDCVRGMVRYCAPDLSSSAAIEGPRWSPTVLGQGRAHGGAWTSIAPQEGRGLCSEAEVFPGEGSGLGGGLPVPGGPRALEMGALRELGGPQLGPRLVRLTCSGVQAPG